MIEKSVEKEFKWRNVGHQYYAAIAANLIMLGHGTIVGWVSPASVKLTDENSPLTTGPLTNEQLSWIGSINCGGAIAGTFTFGYIAALFGCKRAMIFLAFPSILFWTLIQFGDSYYHILIARVASGFTGGGIQSTLVLYVSEIANNNIRGRLGSLSNLIRNIGILLSFTIGAVVDYEYLPRIFVIIQVIYLILFILLPNTPQFYMKRGQFQEAEKALKYYRGFEGKTEQEFSEINKELENLKAIAKERKIDEKLQLKDFCEKQAIRGLIVGIMLAAITQITGSFTYISYSVLMFEKTETTIDPHVSSIVMATMQIFGTMFSAQLADSLGRKLLSVISLVGSAIGNGTLALYMYLHLNGYDMTSYSWIPVTCISFVMFITSAGIISLCGIYTVENLPPKIRGIGLVIATIGLNIATFSCVKFFPILIEIIELHGCLIIFTIGCLLGTMFVLIMMKETKGQSMDSITK